VPKGTRPRRPQRKALPFRGVFGYVRKFDVSEFLIGSRARARRTNTAELLDTKKARLCRPGLFVLCCSFLLWAPHDAKQSHQGLRKGVR